MSSVAQTTTQKEALVVTTFALAGDPVSRSLRSDALAVSEALLGLGYDVRRLENPNATAVSNALSAAPSVIYYAGTEAELAAELSAPLTAASSDPKMVFLDICRAELVLDGEITPAWSLPETLPEDVFVAASIAPESPCGVATSPVADRLLEGLQVPGLSLDLAFATDEDDDTASLWTQSTLRAPHVFRQPSSDTRLTADDYALLDTLSPDAQAKMISLWTQAGIAVDRDGAAAIASAAPQVVVQDTIVLSEPVRPVQTASAVVVPRVTSRTAQVQDAITVIAPDATQSVENRAVPGVGGLPTPSVIVGLIATEASFGTVTEDGGALTASEFDYTNLEGRRAMRADDPELFASLVESGAFDPPPSLLVVALQEELTRMDCYNRGIDGSWGSGSQAGLRRFYEQIDAAPDNLQPTLAAFRQILAQDDVECPPVVVAQPARPAAPAASTPRRTTSAPAPSRPRATAPAPAPAPAAPSRTINRSTGTGIFR